MTTPQGTSTGRARQIAEAAHAGQVDKAGRPYVEHVARVAARCDGRDQAVAWLHDVLEDTPITADDLRATGIEADVIEAVKAITRARGEDPGAYYARVKSNPMALRVKHADLADNADPQRLAALDAPTRDRLTAKYASARRALDVP